MQEATKKTTQEIVDVLTTSDYSKKFKLMTTTAVEKFTKVVGHVLLRDFIAYNDIDLSGINQRRLLVKLKEHCEYHRYFTEKYVEIKFDKKSLHDFFETYDNAALIELTKKIEKKKVEKVEIVKSTKKVSPLIKLANEIIDFVYQKKDGSIRIARGTTNINLIPEFARSNHATPDYEDNNTIRYFDSHRQAWRMFRKDLLLECQLPITCYAE